MFKSITKNAAEIGISVNTKKTQLLAIIPPHRQGTRTFVQSRDDDNNIITTLSGDELKILGFYFGTKPNASRHVFHLKRKFWARAWVLRHLSKAGLPCNDLVKIYKSLVRPILDYSAIIYHSILNKTENKEMEDLQKKDLRIIYGRKTTYQDCLELSGVETLFDSRAALVDAFFKKTIANPRYEEWFPVRKFIHHDMRKENIYVEKFARSDRLYMNPLYFYRRRLNEIGL